MKVMRDRSLFGFAVVIVIVILGAGSAAFFAILVSGLPGGRGVRVVFRSDPLRVAPKPHDLTEDLLGRLKQALDQAAIIGRQDRDPSRVSLDRAAIAASA